MHTIILSHERSLNKTEGLLNYYKGTDVTIVVDQHSGIDRPYLKMASRILISKSYDIIEITSKIKKCDAIICVSENLLPIQSQLESYYGISNISAFAAEVLSNKQKFDDFCREIGFGHLVPQSITPTFYKQLDIFGNGEIFTKPDIGTGSNVFFPGDQQSAPSIEYRRWNNRHHFLSYLKGKKIHNDFFEINKQGIYSQRFNYKACRIMIQEYFWSEEPSISPICYIKDGKANILFYVKNSKIKYGDKLDPLSNPISSHSVSKDSDIVRERAAWILDSTEVPETIKITAETFLQAIADKLSIKNMFISGPDFHITGGRIIAIDFNPRTGQFINILDNINNGTIIGNALHGTAVEIKKKLLWGCAVLNPGVIKDVGPLDHIKKYFNTQNTALSPGVVIPEFQNLQNKEFNINLDIQGSNEQELFNNYIEINQLLQNSITY